MPDGPVTLARREFLFASGAAALANASPSDDLRMVVDGKGGIELQRKLPLDQWSSVWSVSAATLEGLLGSDVALEPEPPLAVACTGRLLARTGARLRFYASRHSPAIWAIGATLTPAGGTPIAFGPRPVASAPTAFEAAVPVQHAAPFRSVLPQPQPQWPGSTLQLDLHAATLTLLASGGKGFRVWPDLPEVRALLLPSEVMRHGWPVAASARDLIRLPPVTIGAHAGLLVRFECDGETQVALGAAPGRARALLVDGSGWLAVGDATAVRVEGWLQLAAEDGRTTLGLTGRLPDRAQVVVTPSTSFVLDGMDDARDTVQVEAVDGRVTGFRVSGRLSHCALRLPLGGNRPGHADLGRLDFTRDAGSRLALQLGALPSPETAGLARLGASRMPPVELSLATARLHLRRERDLVSLTFGFRNLVLEVGDGPPRLRLPDGPSAAFPDPRNIPALIAEFPPQHVQEHAIARRSLPRPWSPSLTAEQARRARDPAQRSAVYSELKIDQEPFIKAFRKVLADYLAADHPDNQWLGLDYALTAQARLAARKATLPAAQRQIADLKLDLPLKVLQSVFASNAAADVHLQELLQEAERRDADHVTVQAAWREQAAPGRPARFYHPDAWRSSWPKEVPPGKVREALTQMWKQIPGVGDGPIKQADIKAADAALVQADEETFDSMQVVEARAAGTSHLVFDLSCPERTMPYSVAALLDWDKLDLRVSRRAERFEPGTPEALAAALQHQGIAPGGKVSPRLDQVAAAARTDEDAWETTRIEVPSRLHLSPAADAHFRLSPLPAPGRPAPLWRAELREARGKRRTLRAIGSPDFRPGALDGTNVPPERGPTPSWTRDGKPFRSGLDAYDRHELVGLSSVYGLPVIPRQTSKLDASQLRPPPKYALHDIDRNDSVDQAIYVPQPLSARLFTLSAHGATLDLDTSFVPPAALRDADGHNLFEAFSIDRWRCRMVLGRDILTEVLYKGFLYPLGHLATLVKVTERRIELEAGQRIAYLTQRLFIQLGSPTKTYWAPGQPFAGRGFPATAVTMLTTQTPDLVEPFNSLGALQEEYGEPSPEGRLCRANGVGLVFWPRSAPTQAGDVRFQMRIDKDADAVSLPFLFVDNAAAHEPAEMQALKRYYNSTLPATDARRMMQHRGARRRYAPERVPGDTAFETESWVLRADSRRPSPDASATETDDLVDFRVDAALEGADQPPFYPRLLQAVIRHGPAERLTGNAQAPLTVAYARRYLEQGFLAEDEAAARERPGHDAFFSIVSSGPVMTFGNNGDRVGALARPELPIKSIARIGPIGTKLGPGDPPPFGQGFFGENAKLLGLITFDELLKAALNSTRVKAAPLLHEFADYGCEALGTVSKDLLPPLRGLRAKCDSPAIAGAYRAAVDALDVAIKSLERLDICTADSVASLLPPAAAALRNLAVQLERIAASPLSGLSDLARDALGQARQALVGALENWTTLAHGEAEAGIRALADEALNAATPWLLPVDADWLIAHALLQDHEALAKLEAQIAAALDEAFRKALATPKPDLQAFRQDVADRFTATLEASSEAPLRKWAQQAGTLVNTFGTAPPVLAGLYSLGVALHDGRGWPGLLTTIGENAASWRPLVEAAAQVCNGTLAAWDALRSMVLPVDVSALIGCDSLDDACAKHDAGWCADFWSAVCALQDRTALVRATDTLLHDLRVLTLALRQQPSCDPAALAGLWQRGWAAWSQVQGSLAEWLDALADAPAPDPVLQQAAILLGRLAPTQAAVDEAHSKLAAVIPDTQALNDVFSSVTKARAALAAKPTDALEEASQSCRQLGQTLAAHAGAMLDRLILQPAAASSRDRLMTASASLLPLAGGVYDAILKIRTAVLPELAKADVAVGLSASGDSLACALFSNPGGGPCSTDPKDDLTRERDGLAQPGDPVVTLLNLTERWATRRAAAPKIVDHIAERMSQAVLVGALQLLDLGDLREGLATALADLVPSSIRRSYEYVLPLEDVGGIVKFIPRDDKALRLAATGTAAVRTDSSVAGQFIIDTSLSPFDLELFGFLTLRFKAFTFRAGPGRSGKLDAPFDKVVIGAKLAFIAALAAYLGYSGGRSPGTKRNGPYLEPRAAGPGLVAGFRLGVPNFNLGNVGFANIAFDGHCELPFDDKKGSVNLGLCSRERPFIISYAPYGGSGFVGITADAKTITGMDVSLEFGGAGVVSFGPLDGVGRLMSGIYCVKDPTSGVTLFSTFSSSFTGSIAGFGIASSFVLALGWNDTTKTLKGEATLSFSFDTGLDISITFYVKIARDEGGRIGASGASNAQSTAWIGDAPQIIPASTAEPYGTGTARMPSALGDWAGHRRVFDTTVVAAGSRRSFT